MDSHRVLALKRSLLFNDFTSHMLKRYVHKIRMCPVCCFVSAALPCAHISTTSCFLLCDIDNSYEIMAYSSRINVAY